jgi:hypothetical protein
LAIPPYFRRINASDRRHPRFGGRHVETFLQKKIGLVYPINKNLTALLKRHADRLALGMPYLGMQVLIEGLALAAFGVQRDMATEGSLAKQKLAYVSRTRPDTSPWAESR